MMKLELDLMDHNDKISNMRYSVFRTKILAECRNTFENFFDTEMRKIETSNDEKTANFVEKLFGNMEFVGELFRRKILPVSTLLMIFGSLLAITNETNKIGIDDLTVEAAINLMNKVGPRFEEEC
jgi:CRISPR/Cas system CSM-associated protein Csm3 (group 7 of RAMP superfamily)